MIHGIGQQEHHVLDRQQPRHRQQDRQGSPAHGQVGQAQGSPQTWHHRRRGQKLQPVERQDSHRPGGPVIHQLGQPRYQVGVALFGQLVLKL